MIFFIAAFSIAMLAAFGVSRLMQDLKERQKRGIYAFLLFAAGLVLLFLVVCAAAREPILNAISSHVRPYLSLHYSASLAVQKIQSLRSNYPVFLKGLSWALGLVLMNAGLIFLLVSRKVTGGAWAALASFVLVLDLWIVWLGGENPFIRPAPKPSVYFVEDEATSFLKRQEGLFRVYPYTYEHTNDSYLMHHGIESVAGYHGNQLQSYQEFIGAGKSVMFNASNLDRQNFLDLLNVKYIISFALPEDVSRFDERTRETIESMRAFFSRESFEQVFSGRRYAIYENTESLERAVLVPGYEVIEREMILDRLRDDSFDPNSTVLLEEDPGIGMSGGLGPVGRVEILEHGPNRIALKTEASQNTILFLSENYYDQWRVRVDGERRKIYRADYTFRGIPLEEGVHTVEIEYDSPALKLGATLSMFSMVILVLCISFWRRDMVRSRLRRSRGLK
jgi:hypothetical protein